MKFTLTLAALAIAFSALLSAHPQVGDPDYDPTNDPDSELYEMPIPDTSTLNVFEKGTPALAAKVNNNFVILHKVQLHSVEAQETVLDRLLEVKSMGGSLGIDVNNTNKMVTLNSAAIATFLGTAVQADRILQDAAGETVGIVLGQELIAGQAPLYIVQLTSGLLIKVDVELDINPNVSGFQTPMLPVVPVVATTKFLSSGNACVNEASTIFNFTDIINAPQTDLLLNYLTLKEYGSSSIFLHSNAAESSGVQTGAFTLTSAGFITATINEVLSIDSVLSYDSATRTFQCVVESVPYMNDALAQVKTLTDFEPVIVNNVGYHLVPGIAPFTIVEAP